MIRTIIKEILPDIRAINFTDLVCGVVTTGVQNIMSEGQTVARKVFPMYENDPTDCQNGDYVLCVPDEKYRSIIYFEEISNTITAKTNYETKISSDVRLIAWWDTKRIGSTMTSAEIMGLIVQNIPSTVADTSNLFNIRIDVSGYEKKSANLFSGYTYDEAETQYLIFPYDYCAFTLTVTYSVNPCLDDIDLVDNCSKRNAGGVIYNVIRNSDDSYHISIGCGLDFVLPDIKFTDSDGVVYNIPSMTNIIATLCGGVLNMPIQEYNVDLTEGLITEINTVAYASTNVGYLFTKVLMVLSNPTAGEYITPILRQKVLGDSDIIEIGYNAGEGETISGLKLSIIFYNN